MQAAYAQVDGLYRVALNVNGFMDFLRIKEY
jgi:hypothetical protein